MMRAAIYWAPELDDPLHAAGSAWLGRDAETGASLPQPPLPGIAELTADARGYGLHATLKPPFRLATSYLELREDLAAFARRLAPFALPPLAVADLKGFLALRETTPCPALHALADAAVAALDAHRAAPTAEELARRRRAGLSPRQESLLAQFGYPYVREEWRFHVTLTRRLAAEEAGPVRAAAESHFAGIADHPRHVASVCLFTQAAPGAPFLIAERFPLGDQDP
jgi:putative phosphonate metabolism protein